MDFVDATILRLADESLRNAVLDGESLSQIVTASHDVAGTGIDAPFTMTFEEVSVVHDDEPRVELSGSWMTMGHTERTEVAVQAAGIGAAIPRIDVLIAGAVTATARAGGSVVDRADLAPWTPEPSAAVPAGARTTATLHFADGPDETARRRRFPVAAALMIRLAPLSLAGLLDETRRLRPHLGRLGFGLRTDPGTRARRSPIVAWVVPAVLFDDDDWPGATTGSAAERRAQRRRWAGAWLARERIGLIVPPT